MKSTIMRIVVCAWLATNAFAAGADWPQWRGPERSNVSSGTGLLKEWPTEGPPLLWKAIGLGDGVAPVSVVGERLFTTGVKGDDEHCIALSTKDGKELWSVKIGPSAKENGIMRYLSQRAPTVDEDRVYAVSAAGDYVCLAAESGKEVWRKHFQKDFQGKRSVWGFCDYPLVDGDKLIICPGGETMTVAALDKKTGDLIWACPIPGEGYAHSMLVAGELDGAKQYVNHLSKSLVGVAAKDGKLLWKLPRKSLLTAITYSPIVHGDSVFYASGYGAGHFLLKITKQDAEWDLKEQYRDKGPYVSWLGSATRVDDHLFLTSNSGMLCRDWITGNELWEEKLGRCSYTIADGLLYIRLQKGEMCLANATAKEYRRIAKFSPPRTDDKAPAWTFPVVANGRLFIRDYDTLLCYDVRDPDRRVRKTPDAVFVPTPPDVVKKMLELAGTKKADIVYDLGSGDGRIVIVAAKDYGCQAVGVELDKDLVTKSRERARDAGVEKLVTIENVNLFEADFSSATVVALYILPEMSRKLIDKFDKLKPGSRIVSHAFAIPGIVPDKTIKVTSDDDDVERPLFLYTVPLNPQKAAKP